MSGTERERTRRRLEGEERGRREVDELGVGERRREGGGRWWGDGGEMAGLGERVVFVGESRRCGLAEGWFSMGGLCGVRSAGASPSVSRVEFKNSAKSESHRFSKNFDQKNADTVMCHAAGTAARYVRPHHNRANFAIS